MHVFNKLRRLIGGDAAQGRKMQKVAALHKGFNNRATHPPHGHVFPFALCCREFYIIPGLVIKAARQGGFEADRDLLFARPL